MKIFSFDLGSGSMGECVREDAQIVHLDSLILDPEFASTKHMVTIRRGFRSRQAHKAREEWWNSCAKEAGLEVLSSAQPTQQNPSAKPDERLLREFPQKGDDTIYTSCLLRIALLQDQPLQSWQVYKAIRSAMQHRGYDKDIAWDSELKAIEKKKKAGLPLSARETKRMEDLGDDGKATDVYILELKKILPQEYHLPCYYEAYKLGLWNPDNPRQFKQTLSTFSMPARNKGADKKAMLVAPRKIVVEELHLLLTHAAKQYPSLKGKEKMIIFGPAEKPYASVNDKEYQHFRGREWEWQGLLGQKTPRFDNRIISKCRLISRLNVCKADDLLNKEVSFLLALLNMRFSYAEQPLAMLEPEQLGQLFETYKERLELLSKDVILARDWKKEINAFGGTVSEAPKSVPMPKFGGRSSFCRPALVLLKELILSGKNPHDFYVQKTASLTNQDPLKGLVKKDYDFLLKMPNDWKKIHIPDNREDHKGLSEEARKEKLAEVLGKINNPVVKHRLWLLTQRLAFLAEKHGQPDRVVIEVARDEFMSEEKLKELEKERAKHKKEIAAALQDVARKDVLKMRLFREQGGVDLYDVSENRKLAEVNLADYQIDHIVPRARGGSDSFVNKVLTKQALNTDKADQTPYEWLHKDKNGWSKFLENIKEAKRLSKHKKELLIAEKAVELDHSRNDLQATAYIEKLAQQMICLHFGWGLNTTGDERKVFTVTGGKTAEIRRKYGLDRLLHSPEEFKLLVEKGTINQKNRENDRHHALDALVLSIAKEYKYDPVCKTDKAPDFFTPPFCRQALDKVFPSKIRSLKPALRETIYALKEQLVGSERRFFFVTKSNSATGEYLKIKDATKKSKKIFDPIIRKAFVEKLAEPSLTEEAWQKFLKDYCGYNEEKQMFERIKKITVVSDRCPMTGFLKEEVYTSDGQCKTIIGGHGEVGKMKGQWFCRKEATHGMIIYKKKTKKGEQWETETIEPFESPYRKLKEYAATYGTIQHWRSGDKLMLSADVDGNVVKKVDQKEKRSPVVLKKGLYRLATISSGRVKMVNLAGGETFDASLQTVLEQGKIQKHEN